MKTKSTVKRSICRAMLCMMLCSVLLVSSTLTAFAAPTSKGSAQDLGQSGVVQGHLDGLGTTNWYKITPSASQYYRFTFYNQSIETRLGISVADSLLNMFLGHMSITIYDQYDAILAEGNVKCGYTGSVSLRLEKGQTYYIRLSSTVAGNYRLTTANFADIGANTWNGAEDMLANGQMISSIDASSDVDWFKFVADAEQSYYRFALENINGSGYKYFELYEHVPGAGETPLRAVWNFNVNQGSTVSKDAQLIPGHTYYYKIRGSVGGYQLNVSQTLDVAGSTFDTAYTIETEKKYTTSFDGQGDLDYFKFTTGDKDAYYHFTVGSLLDHGTYIQFELRDSSNNRVDKYDTHTNSFPKTVSYRLEPNSVYYFCISKDSKDIGNYTIQVNTQEDTYPNTREEAAPVQTGTLYTTSFDGNGDVDYFKLTTGAKDAYYHFVVNKLFAEGTYIQFYLYDADGNQIDQYDIHTNSFPKTVSYRLEPNSEYYFRLSKDSVNIGNYTFRINVQEDAYPNTREEAAPVQTGTLYTTSFDGNGDVDYFKFTTGAKDAYYHFVVNKLFAEGTYIQFYLYDADGNQIDQYDIHTNSFPKTVSYRLEPNSEYYFRLSKDSVNIGNYTFQVKVQEDAVANVRENATLIQAGKEYTGSFDGNGDVDYYKFTTGGQNAYYRFNVGVQLNTSTNVDFCLYDDTGAKVGSYDTHTSYFPKSVNYKLESGRTYYFLLTKDSADIGNYTFSVDVILDLEGDTKATALPIQMNKPTTYQLAADGDVDWFTFTVDYDGDYRLYFFNETAGSIYAYLYNSYDREIKFLSFTTEWNKTVSLDAGTYYLKVCRDYGSPKFYTMAIADCADEHCEKATYPTPATTSRDGVKKTVCAYCGTVIKTEKVARISSVSLTKTSFTCTGKAITPTVKVVDADGKTISSAYYTLKVSANGTVPGKYTVTVTFKGRYGGTKTLSYSVVLATPTVTAKGNSKQINVTWNKVPGATAYAVYYRQYAGGKWSGWIKAPSTTTTSYVHTGAVAGRQYQYIVKAYRGSANTSAFGYSSVAVRLAQPAVVKAVGKTNGITVTWSKVTGAKGYFVYARRYVGGKWSGWTRVYTTTTANTFVDTKAAYGVSSQYIVYACNGASMSSASTAVSAIRLAAPTAVKSVRYSAGVKTTWNKVAGTSGYVVYRRIYNASTGKYSGWVKLDVTTANSYLDTGVKKNVYYQYAVVAYRGSHISNLTDSNRVRG